MLQLTLALSGCTLVRGMQSMGSPHVQASLPAGVYIHNVTMESYNGAWDVNGLYVVRQEIHDLMSRHDEAKENYRMKSCYFASLDCFRNESSDPKRVWAPKILLMAYPSPNKCWTFHQNGGSPNFQLHNTRRQRAELGFGIPQNQGMDVYTFPPNYATPIRRQEDIKRMYELGIVTVGKLRTWYNRLEEQHSYNDHEPMDDLKTYIGNFLAELENQIAQEEKYEEEEKRPNKIAVKLAEAESSRVDKEGFTEEQRVSGIKDVVEIYTVTYTNAGQVEEWKEYSGKYPSITDIRTAILKRSDGYPVYKAHLNYRGMGTYYRLWEGQEYLKKKQADTIAREQAELAEKEWREEMEFFESIRNKTPEEQYFAKLRRQQMRDEQRRVAEALDRSTQGDHLADCTKLSQEEIKNLKVIKYKTVKRDGGDEMTCSICHDVIEDDDDVFDLECGHYDHNDCLKSWFMTGKATCPTCNEVPKNKLV